jgi:proline-specific peptidase
MREGYVTVDENDLWYAVYGEEKDGIPLLVVHGGPGFLTMPQGVGELAEDRPVYFYDQLGCGRSDRAIDKSLYTREYYINELGEVRQQLGLDTVYLMGFSWGTALVCSYMLNVNPSGVKGLILCGPLLSTARWDADQRDNIALLPQNIVKAIEDGEREEDYGERYQAAMMEYYKKHVCRLDPWPAYLEDAFSALNDDVYHAMWGPSEFTITGNLSRLNLTPELYRISQPVLLTCGDHDEAGVKTVKDYQMTFPNAQLAVIPNSSHLHQIEQPVIFRCIVRTFLDDCEFRLMD